MKHTLETIPKVPGHGEQRTLPGKALQNLFFIRLMPSRTGDIADFPNTEGEKTQTHRQNENRKI